MNNQELINAARHYAAFETNMAGCRIVTDLTDALEATEGKLAKARKRLEWHDDIECPECGEWGNCELDAPLCDTGFVRFCSTCHCVHSLYGRCECGESE